MNYLEGFYNRIGSLFCHQLAERTIDIGGVPLPVCARDTGIYLGVFVSAIYLFVRGRFDSDKPPRIFHGILLCLFMLPMAVDGVSSYIGLRETNNYIRLLTGLAFGLSIPFFLIPATNFKIYGKNTKDVLHSAWELLLLYMASAWTCLTILKMNWFSWSMVSSGIIIGFVFLITRLVFTITHRCKPMRRTKEWVAVLTLTVGVLIVLYFISSYILQPLKYLLLRR